jgi:hypothetical protein
MREKVPADRDFTVRIGGMALKKRLAPAAAALAAALFPTISPGAPIPGHTGTNAGGLVVKERFDPTNGVPTEGWVSYLVVRHAVSGRVALRDSQTAPLHVESVLSRGAYKLRSFIRTCSGNCGSLDPSSNPCSAAFRLRAGDRIRATIHRDARQHCRVSFR